MKKSIILLTIMSLVFFAHSARTEVEEWVQIGPSGYTTEITCMTLHGEDEFLLVGTYEGFWYYTFETGDWIQVEDVGYWGREVYGIATTPNVEGRVVTGRENAFFKGYIEVVDNWGATPVFFYESTGGFISDVQNDPSDPSVFYACGWHDIAPGELMKSTDDGENWVQLTGEIPYAMTEIAIDPADSEVVYVCGGSSSGIPLVSKSIDGGSSWLVKQDGLPAELVNCISVSPLDSDILVCANGSIYRSTDGADNWQLITGIDVKRFDFNPQIPNMVAGVTPNQLFVSLDSGETWEDWTGEYPGSDMVDLTFSADGDTVFVTSSTQGVYKGILGEIPSHVETDDIDVGKNPILHRNYPNPFNPETTIGFSVPEESHVTLEIYNINGQLVKTLTNEKKHAGEYKVNWNGTDDAGKSVSSGIYFYKIQTGDYTDIKKAILMK